MANQFFCQKYSATMNVSISAFTAAIMIIISVTIPPISSQENVQVLRQTIEGRPQNRSDFKFACPSDFFQIRHADGNISPGAASTRSNGDGDCVVIRDLQRRNKIKRPRNGGRGHRGTKETPPPPPITISRQGGGQFVEFAIKNNSIWFSGFASPGAKNTLLSYSSNGSALDNGVVVNNNCPLHIFTVFRSENCAHSESITAVQFATSSEIPKTHCSKHKLTATNTVHAYARFRINTDDGEQNHDDYTKCCNTGPHAAPFSESSSYFFDVVEPLAFRLKCSAKCNNNIRNDKSSATTAQPSSSAPSPAVSSKIPPSVEPSLMVPSAAAAAPSEDQPTTATTDRSDTFLRSDGKKKREWYAVEDWWDIGVALLLMGAFFTSMFLPYYLCCFPEFRPEFCPMFYSSRFVPELIWPSATAVGAPVYPVAAP